MSRYIIDTDKHMSPFDGIIMTTVSGLEDADKALDDAYQRGLKDAWEAARKIICDEKLGWDTLLHLFNKCTFTGIFGGFSASEAIAKLKAYEEKQKAADEIKVGDEVIYNGTTKCVVVTPETDKKYASLFDCNGIHYSASHRECKKTGRHFDIASILEEMRK